MELSGLRNGSVNVTDGFVNVKRVTCVKGVYPQHLIEEWEIYNDSCLRGSENDHPEIFGEDQLYIVFELCNAGIDLEAFQFKQAEEALSVFLQVSFTENFFLRVLDVIFYLICCPAKKNPPWMGVNLVHL